MIDSGQRNEQHPPSRGSFDAGWRWHAPSWSQSSFLALVWVALVASLTAWTSLARGNGVTPDLSIVVLSILVIVGAALLGTLSAPPKSWHRYALLTASGSAFGLALATGSLTRNAPGVQTNHDLIPVASLALTGLGLLTLAFGKHARLVCISAVASTLAATLHLLALFAPFTRIDPLLALRGNTFTAIPAFLAVANLLTILAGVRYDRAAGRPSFRWAPWGALAAGLVLTAIMTLALQRWQQNALLAQTRSEAIAAANHIGTLLDNRLQRLHPSRVERAGVDDQSVPGLIWYGRRNPSGTTTQFIAEVWKVREDELITTVTTAAPRIPPSSVMLRRAELPGGQPALLVQWSRPDGEVMAVLDPEVFFAPAMQATVNRGSALTLSLNGEPLLAAGTPHPGTPAVTARVPTTQADIGVLRVSTRLGAMRAQLLLVPFPWVIGALGILATLLLAAALAIGWRQAATNRRLRQMSQQLQEEIDERRTIERLLAEREARLQAVLRQLPAIVWTVDHDLVFTSSEGSGLAQLGLRPGQVVGQTLFEYFGTEDPEFLPIRLHRLALAGEPQEYEFEWSEHVYRVRLEPLRDRSGAITGVIGIAFDITEQVRTRQQLERLARTDGLTGLANRSAVIASLEQLIGAGHPFAALLLDLDGFKAVNDTLGHVAGDALLREVATRLTRTVRRDDIVGRLGGDEFLIIAPLCDRDGARELAARLLIALSHPYRIDGQIVTLGASIGVVLCTPDNPCEASEVLRNADLALYSAKRRGKGRIVFFHPELAEEAPQEFALAQALREGIERETVVFRGLPIVHLRTGELVGVELFASWVDPQGKERRAEDLAGVAARAGMDIILAQRAVAEALAWLHELPERWFLVLAFPSAALLDETVTDLLTGQLATQPALRGRLWLDLPTSVLCVPGSSERLTTLAAEQIGVFVRDPVLTPEGIDPFVNLQRIGIRIPSGFVRSFLNDPRAAALTRALLEVANELSLVSLAESIDEFAVYLALARSGCTLGQGPLFGGDFDRQKAIEAARHVRHWRHLAAASVDTTVTERLLASPTATDQDEEGRPT